MADLRINRSLLINVGNSIVFYEPCESPSLYTEKRILAGTVNFSTSKIVEKRKNISTLVEKASKLNIEILTSKLPAR